jgi:hypothetical protein
MARKVFHYGRGFGVATWCGRYIPTLEESRAGRKGPDWGGALTESVNCEACIIQFIKVTSYDLTDAIQALQKLKEKK